MALSHLFIYFTSSLSPLLIMSAWNWTKRFFVHILRIMICVKVNIICFTHSISFISSLVSHSLLPRLRNGFPFDSVSSSCLVSLFFLATLSPLTCSLKINAKLYHYFCKAALWHCFLIKHYIESNSCLTLYVWWFLDVWFLIHLRHLESDVQSPCKKPE